MKEPARPMDGQEGGDAILTIRSGVSQVDCQDWAEMLARMYRRWAERRGFGLEVIEYMEGEEVGINSATFILKDEYAFRLRISSFSSSSKHPMPRSLLGSPATFIALRHTPCFRHLFPPVARSHRSRAG